MQNADNFMGYIASESIIRERKTRGAAPSAPPPLGVSENDGFRSNVSHEIVGILHTGWLRLGAPAKLFWAQDGASQHAF
mgnify:CR=1 FL=1